MKNVAYLMLVVCLAITAVGCTKEPTQRAPMVDVTVDGVQMVPKQTQQPVQRPVIDINVTAQQPAAQPAVAKTESAPKTQDTK